MTRGIVIAGLAIGGAVVATVLATKSTASPTPSPTVTPQNCASLLQSLPPDVQVGMIDAGQKALGNQDPNDPNVAKNVNNAIAAYLVARNYPTIANCLTANPPTFLPPNIAGPTNPPAVGALTDCQTLMAKLPPDVITRLKSTINAIQAVAPNASNDQIAAQASYTLDSLGYHQEAACLRQYGTAAGNVDPGGTGGTGGTTAPTASDCQTLMANLPPDVKAQMQTLIAAIPKTALPPAGALSGFTAADVEPVAQALDGLGYHDQATCIRNSPANLGGFVTS